jgi:1,4-dihydroxy-2-naphthoate octaprenyltransferase
LFLALNLQVTFYSIVVLMVTFCNALCKRERERRGGIESIIFLGRKMCVQVREPFSVLFSIVCYGLVCFFLQFQLMFFPFWIWAQRTFSVCIVCVSERVFDGIDIQEDIWWLCENSVWGMSTELHIVFSGKCVVLFQQLEALW